MDSCEAKVRRFQSIFQMNGPFWPIQNHSPAFKVIQGQLRVKYTYDYLLMPFL